MIPARNNTHTEKGTITERAFVFFARKFVIMHVGSPVWPRSGKQASIFTSRSSDRASFLEEVMISLLNGFSARWPRQDKQSAAGRKNGVGVERYVWRGRVEGRPKHALRQ